MSVCLFACKSLHGLVPFKVCEHSSLISVYYVKAFCFLLYLCYSFISKFNATGCMTVEICSFAIISQVYSMFDILVFVSCPC